MAVLVCAAVLVAPAGALAVDSISGTVTEEAAGHAPIEDVRVCAWGQDGEESESEAAPYCELTDSVGGYAITGLPEGEYKVQFWPGFKGLNYISEFYDDEPSWFEADSIEVTTAKTGVDAELTEGGEIQGKVTNQIGGAAIAGVFVCAEEEESPWYFECGETDAAGDYTVPGLPAGGYWLEFWPEGSNFLFHSEPEVPVTLGAVTQRDAALAPAARITGQVTDAATHAGVEGVFACAIDVVEEEITRCAETGALGIYSLGSLPPAGYKVGFALFGEEEGGIEAQYVPQFFNGKTTFAAADPISLGAGATRGGVDAALVKKGATRVAVLPVPPVLATAPIRKPHKACRKGFRKAKVKGKSKCVKSKKHGHRRRHHGR